MARKIQITVSTKQYEHAKAESRRSSVSVSELFRRGYDNTYDPNGANTVLEITHILGRRAGVPLDGPDEAR